MSKVDKEKGNIPNAKKSIGRVRRLRQAQGLRSKRFTYSQYRRNASNINFDIKNLKSLEIRNFKSIKNEILQLEDATFLSGFNSSGKSSFSHALLLILQWLDNLTTSQPGKVPINGPLIQLGNSAEKILNRNINSVNDDVKVDQPSQIILKWENSKDENTLVSFSLSKDLETQGSFKLTEVLLTQTINTKNKNKDKIQYKWKYAYSDPLIMSKLHILGQYLEAKGSQILEAPSFESMGGPSKETLISTLNNKKSEPYFFRSFDFYEEDKKGLKTNFIYIINPGNIKLNNNQKPLDSGEFMMGEGTKRYTEDAQSIGYEDFQLFKTNDWFKFLIFRSLSNLILNTPKDLDKELGITKNITAIRSNKIKLSDEHVTSDPLSNLNFKPRTDERPLTRQMSQFLEVVTPPPLMTPQGKIPFFGEDTLSQLFGEAMDDLNDKLEEYYFENIDKKSKKKPEFFASTIEEYVDAVNLRELLNLKDISASRDTINKSVRNTRRYGRTAFPAYDQTENTLREFQSNTLLNFLDEKNKKAHKSINESDAWSDEFKDILSSNGNSYGILIEQVSPKMQNQATIQDFSPLAKNTDKAIVEYLIPDKSFIDSAASEEFVYEPYELEQGITKTLSTKAKYSVEKLQDSFLDVISTIKTDINKIFEDTNEAKDIEKHTEELSELHLTYDDLNLERRKLKDNITETQELIAKTQEKLNFQNENPQDSKNMASLMTLEKDFLTAYSKTNKKLLDFGKKIKEKKDLLNKLHSLESNKPDVDKIFDNLDKLIDEKAATVLRKIFDTCSSDIEKIETYTLLKILLPNFKDSPSDSEYINKFLTNSSSHVTDSTEDISIENLIKSEDYVPVQLDTVTFEQGGFSTYESDKNTFEKFKEFSSNINYLSANRNVADRNELFYGGNSISPLGSKAEFVANFISINGNDKYTCPLPADNQSAIIKEKIAEIKDREGDVFLVYDLPLVDHINIWLSYIFNQDIKANVEELDGLNLYVNEDLIINVGSGINQVLPIVVQLIISEDKLILLEEVEQNLHPSAQANLADMILQFSKSNRKILVESHSDLL